MQQVAASGGSTDSRGSDELLERTEQYRQRYRAEKIPRGYSGPRHVAVTAASVLLPTVFALSRLHDVKPGQWLALPAMFVFGQFLGTLARAR